MPADLSDCWRRAMAATGYDPDLDAALAATLGAEGRPSASVDDAIALLRTRMPAPAHWHVGYAANGVFPYAALTAHGVRHEATAPTVPLALLRALLMAEMAITGL